MNEFNRRHDELFDFASTKGWDGYSAEPVSETIKQNALRIWTEYKLENKKYDIILNSTGTITFEAICVHGHLDIVVDKNEYTVYICDIDLGTDYLNGMTVTL